MIKIFPDHFIDQYGLHQKVKDSYVYTEVRHITYGLPQCGILAKKLLKKCPSKFGCNKVCHTPRLWRHIDRSIQFPIMIDKFGVKYVGKEHALHLKETLERHY